MFLIIPLFNSVLIQHLSEHRRRAMNDKKKKIEFIKILKFLKIERKIEEKFPESVHSFEIS